ncbi:hypothetical protein LG198_14285 [Methylobacillus arboreus]|uniref:hypothetical protein n=1 Tax=Methylobacillus arboreus TaxID=755170 RepID=UPI001E39F92F|nr:hypothetical protein [Methylobacillus arboreus]MCB5191898.1 hypothetical protein [Methylobacillus arboreus]
MPKLFKLFLVVFGILCWITPISVSISFIYQNKYLTEMIVSYGVLFLIYVCFVIFQHRFEKNETKSFFQRLSIGGKLAFVVSSLIFPILVGRGLSLTTPIASDFIASEFAIHEYKLIRVEPYAKTFRKLSKLYVVDINNNEASFVLKNEMLEQLSLRGGDKLITRGRGCIAGFVIDNINGVERK